MYAILASRIVINVRKAAERSLEGNNNSSSEHANSGLSGFGTRQHGGSRSALTITSVTHRHVDGEGMEMSCMLLGLRLQFLGLMLIDWS